LPPLH